ncbi:VanZ family protein [Nocardioides daeguensis]|uniref:VanZ-like domain-containing protein n=1 Tax=Nocardioides daeguensis TaxID=908359 RepID=A0ABP6W645_9ACTN|nr:VanZ family protein [Nocardioides daeguensis]MBV6727854.1 VanZ family protein [Nocardioides daeguensis]MCR1775325.1 VanZ family protein [Nocardioides daeguensis]
MVTFGGTGVMLLGVGVAGVGCALLALVLVRPLGWVSALAIAGLVWSVVVIALVTLVPTSPDTGFVPAETRRPSCSWDIGGPAPEGFWILQSGQRTLNTALFVPSGMLLVVAVARWRLGWVLAPLGLLGLAAYSALIEKTQLELARIDRACDVTDVIDNATGAAFGAVLGVGLVLVLRPWRHRRRTGSARPG